MNKSIFRKSLLCAVISLITICKGLSQTCTNDSIVIDTINLIPNPSFDELFDSPTCLPDGPDCPPAYFTDFDCVQGWVQGNTFPATNDFISLCHAQITGSTFLPYFRLPDEAIAGGFIIIEPLTQTYGIEYLGNTFTEPLKADSSYQFSVQLNLGYTFDSGVLLNQYTISQIGKSLQFSLFGNTTNNNFPYPVYSGYCPTVAHPDDYIELAITEVEITGTNEWIEINMDFTTPTDIDHFIFGSSCEQPDLDVIGDDDFFCYVFMDSFEIIQVKENLFFDNLNLETEVQTDPCQNNTTLSVTNFPEGSYQWYFNDEALEGAEVNTLELLNLVENEGLYFVEVFDGQGNCGFSDTIAFVTESTLSVSEEIKDVDCFGDSTGMIELTVSNANNLSFEWKNENGQVLSTQASIDNIPAGLYTLSIIDDDDCIYTYEYVIDQAPALSLAATSTETGCLGNGLGLIEAVADGGSPEYLFRVNGFPFGENNLFELPEGDYEVEVMDANGCKTILNDIIVAEGVPFVVEINASENPVHLGDQVRLSLIANRPLEQANIQWNLPDLISCDTCESITLNLFETTSLTATVTDANGCMTDADITIQIEKNRTVYIPNIFSPNDDGANDRFEIFPGKAVERILQFKVFDRWGALLYSDPTIGWDGYFKNRKMQTGVYTWFVEVQFLDGYTKQYTGAVTLVR